MVVNSRMYLVGFKLLSTVGVGYKKAQRSYELGLEK